VEEGGPTCCCRLLRSLGARQGGGGAGGSWKQLCSAGEGGACRCCWPRRVWGRAQVPHAVADQCAADVCRPDAGAGRAPPHQLVQRMLRCAHQQQQAGGCVTRLSPERHSPACNPSNVPGDRAVPCQPTPLPTACRAAPRLQAMHAPTLAYPAPPPPPFAAHQRRARRSAGGHGADHPGSHGGGRHPRPPGRRLPPI